LSKTITVSEETWGKIKDQVEAENKDVKEKQEKKLEIKNRWTGAVIYSSSKTTFKDAVVEAVNEGANLRGADFYGADFYGADLRGADLEGANLRGADLRGADLEGANLRGADLRGADLRGANLRGANLRGADLEDANLEGANFYGQGGCTRIKKSQIGDFLKALGVIAAD